ncbi:MAG TPA: stage II sporulation protein M [Thermoanaerobaculia bacterium]|nr:stage II sporulation protein M [Thermoanaerobaculia bacterium]
MRHRRYGADLEQRLNDLVLRGHQQLYRQRGGSVGEIAEFIAAGFPRQVRAEGRLVLLATLLFVVPLLFMGFAAQFKPDLALSVLPGEQIEQAGAQYAPDGDLKAGRPADSDAMMFGFYIYNNIGIAFRTFATGLAFGLGSIFFLVFNGLAIGAIGGYIHQMGYGENFYPFVIGHGAFELTAIVLSGAAGLRLGFALLAPGRLSRSQALLTAARSSVRILYGATGMLVIAAFVEAFWSPSALVPDAVKYSVGGFFWLLVLAYLLVLGRGGERKA